MVDEGSETAKQSELGRWLRAELNSLNARDGDKRGAEWISKHAIDPDTGSRAVERVAVQKWLTGSKTRPEPASIRALANLFTVRRSHISHLVALDHGYADESSPAEWPHFIPLAAGDLSSKGRTFLSMAAEYACRDEGLIE